MDLLRSFSLLLVFLAFAGVLYRFLLPSGRVSETAKAVLSAAALVCVLSPLFSAVRGLNAWDGSLPSAEPPAFDAAYEAYAAAGRAAVQSVIDETVRGFTDVPYRTEIGVHIPEDLSIDIESVRIIFARRFENMNELMLQLKNRLGVAPAVETEAAE